MDLARRLASPRFLVVASLVLIAACGGGESDPSASLHVQASALQASTLVGPGDTQLDVPAGASDVDVTIVLSAPRSRRPAPEGTVAVATPIRLTPEGQTFDKPLEVTIPISPSALPAGSTMDDVFVVRASQGSDVFVPLPTRRTGNSVVAQTEHFSDFIPVVLASAGNSPFGACLDAICAPTESCTVCPADCGVCLPSTDTKEPSVTTLVAPATPISVAGDTNVAFDFDEAVMDASVSSLTVQLAAGTVNVPGTLRVSGIHVTFTPSAPLAPQTTYTLTVSGVRDLAGNLMAAPYMRTFTTASAATLSGSTPSSGATNVSQYASLSLTFSTSVDSATLSVQTAAGACSGTVQLSFDSFATCVSGTLVVGATGTDVTITQDLPAPGDATGSLRFVGAAADDNGFSITSIPVLTFTVETDVTPPTLRSTTPVDGTLDVPLNSPIVFEFDEPVLDTTIGSFSIDISQNESTVSGDFVVAGRFVTWTPSTSFQRDSSIDIGVGNLEDLHGNYVELWTYLTLHPITSPTVLDTVPPNGWTGAHPRQDLGLTFSRPIAPASFTMQATDSTTCTGSIQLSDGIQCYGGTLIPGTTSLTIQASTSLPFNALMAVTITAAATDDAGVPFWPGQVFSFQVSPINAFTYGITDWGTIDGNIGGLAAADAACTGSGHSHQKALLISPMRYPCTAADCGAGDLGSMDWVLAPGTTYTDGHAHVLFTTDAVHPIFTAWPFAQAFSLTTYDFWFGGTTSWTVDGNDCSGWTSNDGAGSGAFGDGTVTDSSFLFGGSISCAMQRSLLCVEQPQVPTPNLH